MYFTKRTYVKNWEHSAKEEKHVISIKKNSKTVDKSYIDVNKISYIIEEVAYWRKANAIHKWFVDNAQGGEDDCRDAWVEISQIEELVKLCKEVIKKAKLVDGKLHNGTSWSGGVQTENYVDGKIIENAEEIAELLPTEGGFFFGGTDYNEWYLSDVKDTIEALEPVLEAERLEDGSGYKYIGEYYYRSSW